MADEASDVVRGRGVEVGIPGQLGPVLQEFRPEPARRLGDSALVPRPAIAAILPAYWVREENIT